MKTGINTPKYILNPEWVAKQEELNKKNFDRVQKAISAVVSNPEQLKAVSLATFSKRHRRVLSTCLYIAKARSTLKELKSAEQPKKQRIGQIEGHLQRRLSYIKKLGFEVAA